jgi:DNA-binding transcriptional LysR family regulator
MMDNALRYLHEAAVSGSMRAASDKIGVAVSSISRQIAQLEAELNTCLIERGRREIKLTEAGRLALDFYRAQVADREAFQMRLRDLRAVRAGRVQLAVGEGCLGNIFSEMLRDFGTRNPHVEISVTTGSTADIVRWVVNDDAHIGLVLQVPEEPKIRSRAAVPQPLMMLARPDHPLAAKASVTLGDLAEHAVCLPPKDFRIRQLLAVAETRQQVFLQPAITTNSIVLMRQTACSGRAVTILPRMAAMQELQDGSLVGVALDCEGLEMMSVALICRVGRQREGAPIRLLSTMEAKLRIWSSPRCADEHVSIEGVMYTNEEFERAAIR